ncbi:MAG: type II secretion system F family protein [Planctomycetaceae bacterium]|jgi:hypothetical protein|nr:type II secretion system F family protein [Planctomycetaceae bacterium]
MASELSLSSGGQLDRLIALCDEISALVRSGVPIEEALLFKSAGERKQIAAHLKQLAEQVGTGKPLAEAVRNDPLFPPVYAAVIEAGIESGNLAGALDSVAECAQTIRGTRFFLIRAMLYPLCLFTALWFIFCGMILFTGPRMASMFESYQATTLLFGVMKWCGGNLQGPLVVTFAVPVILWGLFCIWIGRSAHGTLIQAAGRFTLLGWVPWGGKAVVQLQKMTFARILTMLIRASLPLDRAILLAARATNDRYWSKESQESLRRLVIESLAVRGTAHDTVHHDAVHHGTLENPPVSSPAAAFPTDNKDNNKEQARSVISPLIFWTLGIPDQKQLIEGIEYYARMSQVRAELLISKCEMFLPEIITFLLAVAIGGSYFLTILWPYTQLLNILSASQG